MLNITAVILKENKWKYLIWQCVRILQIQTQNKMFITYILI